MSTKTTSIIVIVLILVLGIGYFATSANKTDEPVQTTETSTDPSPAAVPPPTLSDDATDSETESEEQATRVAGTYQDYDGEKIAQSNADHILLFFHATWCPSCRALDSDIVAHRERIPAGVEIYKIDYDTATALKRQYGVTTQHSIIEITSSGEALSDISHGLTLEDVLATL